MNCLPAFLLHGETRWSGLVKSPNVTTLFVLHFSVRRRLAEQLLTWGSCNSDGYPGDGPLSLASWGTGSVLCSEGLPSQPSSFGLLIAISSLAYLTIPSQYEQLFLSLQLLPGQVGDFSSALLFVQNINLFLFLTGLQFHPPVPALSNV